MQIQMSNLRLTKIVTIMPYFLVVNSLAVPLRYMEENEQADLWLDIAPQQVWHARHGQGPLTLILT